jgi:L,D-transpeptidase catalytic domain/Bacterial Ig-like domain
VLGEDRPDKQPAGEEPEGAAGKQEAPADGAEATRSKPTGGRGKIIAIATAAALAIGGGAYALSSGGGSGQTHGSHGPALEQAAPLHLRSMTPFAGARQVQGATPIVVGFSSPIAANSPDPTINPAVPGNWSPLGDDLVFTPDQPYRPESPVTVSVPSGPEGVRSANGGLLAAGATEHFTTSGYSQLRLAELLGQLGYLPLTWSEAGSGAARDQTIGADDASETQAGLAYDPPAGTFQWKPGYPSMLRSFWSPDAPNVILEGAVYAFQSEHGMRINGDVTPRLWAALFRAAEANQQNSNGYTYAIANKGTPETLTIWHDGHQVLHSLANTGIPVSPTVDGTFPVFARFRFQIMRGTNPDGSAYADPVSFVSYFNGGDAVHYFPRGAYGFRQSLGCVELPYTSAEEAFPYLTYGSLVSVTG